MSNQPQTASELIRSLPERLIKEKAEGIDVLYHFDISGENGGKYTVRVNEQECKVTEGLHGQPKCIIEATESNFIAVETGKINGPMAVMMGKIKCSHPVSLMKFTEMFKKLF